MGMDVFGKNPTSKDGEYFRANVWSWRPIHQLCETVLKKQLPGWAFNDGEGLETQEECNQLADALEKYLKDFPLERIETESDMRVDAQGKVLRTGDTGGQSAYSTDRGHVEEFITFLRACGGFEIH